MGQSSGASSRSWRTRRASRLRCRVWLHLGAALLLASAAEAQHITAGTTRLAITREFALQGGASESAIGTVTDALFASDGQLLVLDLTDMQVKRYNRTGTALSPIGRKGAGPGEFRGVARAGWRHDSLWVHDPALRRVSVFVNGAFVHTIDATSRLRPPSSGVLPMAIRGRSVQLAVGTASIERDGSQRDWVLVRDDPLTGSVRPVRTLSRRRATMSVKVSVRGQPSQLLGRQPFSDAPIVAADRRGGAVVVDQQLRDTRGAASFSVTSYHSDGSTRFARRFGFTPVPMDRATRLEATSLERQMKADGVRGARFDYDEEDLERTLFVPPSLPPVQEAAVGSDGSIWLTLWASGASATRTHVQLDERGTPRGTISLPKRYRLLDSRDGRLVVGETPWDDVNELVVYRVSAPDGR